MKAFGKLTVTRDPSGRDGCKMLFVDTGMGKGRMWDHRLKDVRLTSRTRAKLRIRASVTDEGALYCLVYPHGYSRPGKITFLFHIPKGYGSVSVTGVDPADHRKFAR